MRNLRFRLKEYFFPSTAIISLLLNYYILYRMDVLSEKYRLFESVT
jgi:hypothetical protein